MLWHFAYLYYKNIVNIIKHQDVHSFCISIINNNNNINNNNSDVLLDHTQKYVHVFFDSSYCWQFNNYDQLNYDQLWLDVHPYLMVTGCIILSDKLVEWLYAGCIFMSFWLFE